MHGESSGPEQQLFPLRTIIQRDLNIDPSTAWRWQKKGILPEPLNLNGRYYYTREQYEAFIDRLKSGEFARKNPLSRDGKEDGA